MSIREALPQKCQLNFDFTKSTLLPYCQKPMENPYLPLFKRIACILQIILSLSVFLWLLFDPFMGEHFRLKEELILIQNLRGDETLKAQLSPSAQAKLSRNQLRFHRLALSQQDQIHEKAKLLEWKLNKPALSKFFHGISSFLFRTPLITLLWIILSLALPIAALKKKPWAFPCSFLLPFLAIAYAYGIYHTATPYSSPYPPEQEVLTFLNKPLSPSLAGQMEDLKKGWELYLIEKWAKEKPSQDLYQTQVENGEYAFNLVLLDHLKKEPQGSLLVVAGAILWNLAFAFVLNWRVKSMLRVCS